MEGTYRSSGGGILVKTQEDIVQGGILRAGGGGGAGGDRFYQGSEQAFSAYIAGQGPFPPSPRGKGASPSGFGGTLRTSNATVQFDPAASAAVPAGGGSGGGTRSGDSDLGGSGSRQDSKPIIDTPKAPSRASGQPNGTSAHDPQAAAAAVIKLL
jgi:hypothetical protein